MADSAKVERSSLAGRRERLWLAALALAASFWLGSSARDGWLRGTELRALDHLMVARYQVHGPGRVDPRIVLVLVDEASFRAVGKPFLVWYDEFARVLSAMGRAGVKAVGFDFILNPERSQLTGPLAEQLDQGEKAMMVALLGAPVVLTRLMDSAGAPDVTSSPRLRMAALSRDKHNLACANALTDPDGTVRMAALQYDPDGRTQALAGRLAELASGDELTFKAGLGDRALVTEQDGTALRLNYPGPGGSFPTLLFSTLLHRLARGDDLAELSGKICLLGPGAPSFQDLTPTPFLLLGQYTAGTEVHAVALNTLLTGAFIQPGPAWLWRVVPLLLCLAVLGLTSRGRPLTGWLVSALLALLYLVFCLEALSRWNQWWPMVPSLLAMAIGITTSYVGRYLTVERDRRYLDRSFRRFVSSQVLEELRQHPDRLELGGTRRRVTILMADINGFTPACEKRKPEEIITMLNHYFEGMVAIIFSHGGMVKQFVGDEIMAIFGAPEPQSDHAARAVTTAVEMLERLDALASQDPQGSLGGFYDIKIGVHTGDVVVGNVGSRDRVEYAAVGDDVNLTARIENLTKTVKARVLVSESTRLEAHSMLPGLEWVPCGQHQVKGRQQPIEVYQVQRKAGPKVVEDQ